ncbi:MAG: hypothetical protein AB7O97_22680 [Planctomycetota bacterium]
MSLHADRDGVSYEVRPEWLAGRYWWRIYVAGNPKVLVRYRHFAIQAAESLAADEALARRRSVDGEAELP